MKKRFKRVGAAFLSLAMILGIMPGVTKPIEVLAANSEPATAYWTEVSSLKTGYNLNGGTIANIRFGESDRKWAICGADGNDLALISTSQFTTAAYDSTSPYASKYSTSDFVTGIDTYLSTTYFSETELTKMQDVAVRTLEYDQSGTREANGSTVTLKLYLPDATSRTSYGSSSIYVGADNNIEIALANLSVTTTNGYFWLRSPNYYNSDDALVASPGGSVNIDDVIHINVSVVPAFNLNLSSVIFASAASAASSSYTGVKENSGMTASTYTLRYAPSDSSWDGTSAVISANKTSVKVSGATSEMYLMVQNSDGVYIADASSDPTINASSITINNNQLTDFDNCKVWLESTDSDRITTAKMATQAPSTYDVTITPASNSHMTKTDDSGAAIQTGITAGSPITSVVYTADSGYYFPTNYNVAEVTGISVHRDSYTQITVSGTPTATTTITLTAATEKASQNAPTGLSDDVDKIAGTTTAMEYASSADAASWNACTADNTTVAAGTWYVRLKETDTQKASTSTSVVVTASQNPPTLYQVTVNSGDGDGTYAEGATVNITAATAPSGKVFDKWEVVSGSVTLASVTNATTTFTMPAGAVVVTATYKDAPVDPSPTPTPTPTPTVTITAGAGGTHQIGTDGSLQITCSGALADLTGIYVDGVLVASTNYTLQSGSTILTFTPAYLNSLSVGTHTVRFQYNSIYADTTFVITAADSTDTTPTKDEVPKTGDSTPVVWLFVVAMISGTGLLYLGRRKKAIR